MVHIQPPLPIEVINSVSGFTDSDAGNPVKKVLLQFHPLCTSATLSTMPPTSKTETSKQPNIPKTNSHTADKHAGESRENHNAVPHLDCIQIRHPRNFSLQHSIAIHRQSSLNDRFGTTSCKAVYSLAKRAVPAVKSTRNRKSPAVFREA